jgi:hypothetical protein
MRRAILVGLVLAAGCGGGEKPAERAAKTCAPSEGETDTVATAPEGLVTELVFDAPTDQAEYDITLRDR